MRSLAGRRSPLTSCTSPSLCRFAPHITAFDDVCQTAVFLVNALGCMGAHVLVTEQVPSKLGSTVAPVAEAVDALPSSQVTRVAKSQFSCITPTTLRAFALHGIRHVVLVGAETHICVAQTAQDLVQAGYTVAIPVEGTSSIRLFDRSMALQRLRCHGSGGMFLTTAEAEVFEHLRDANSPHFKTVQGFVKAYGATMASHALASV